MAKGFMTPRELRAERDAAIASRRHDRRENEPDPAMAWCVANKPGAVPVNGGRRRRIAKFRATGYRLALQRAPRHNKRAHLGRYTPPKRQPVSDQKDSE